MRSLIYSDLQASEGSERCHHDPSMPLQRYRVQLLLGLLWDVFREYNCNSLIDLGDTLDDRQSIPLPTLNTVFEGLKNFVGFQNFKLVGNHDQWLKSGKIHSGSAFHGIFEVFDVPKVWQIDTHAQLLMCPFPADGFDLESWLLEKLDADPHIPIKIVLGHFQVEGTVDRDKRPLKGGVHVGVLEKASLTLLGHIHHPQSISDKIHYVGSPFQQDFGESGEEKRLAILQFPDRENPEHELKLEWITVTGFPTYEEISIEAWERCMETDGDTENRYRVVLNSPADSERYHRNPQMRRAKPIYRGLTTQIADRLGSPRVGRVSFEPKDVLKRFLKTRPPTNQYGMSDDEFVQVGLDILNSSQ